MTQRVALLFVLIAGLSLMTDSCSKRESVTPPPEEIPENIVDTALMGVHRVPPKAQIEQEIDTLFGHERVDNYYWLRERENPDVVSYLEAENAYTDEVMKHAEKLKDELYDEMVGRIKETDLTVPVKRGDYYYYSRTEEGLEYKIHCRKKDSLEAPEQVILDVNKLAEGKAYTSLGVFEISPDQKLLAYGIDTTGDERYTLYVKNLETGELLSDTIPNISTSAVWANDNKTLFYSRPDDAWRPYKLFRHTLGTKPENDVMVYHEPDEFFWLRIARSKSQEYLFIVLSSQTSTEVRFLDANTPDGEFRLVSPRKKDVEYYVYHHGKSFYILTNDNAKNFKLMRVPISEPSMVNWKEVVPERDSVKLDTIDMYRDYLVLYERKNGLRQIRVRDFATKKGYTIDFPEPVYTVYEGENPDYNSDWLRFTYMSLVTPSSVYDYNMRTRERVLKKRQEVLGGYDPDNYQEERLFATAKDGARVPISIAYKKGMIRDGNNPLYLYGYGAYGISMDPYFSSNRISLLDRGFIIAFAHIRGGGEMGRRWYEAGKLLNKMNTFTDFIASAKYLIKEKYTNPKKLVISGGSAGGLLIGAVVNMQPDLFDVAIADVPFVDVVNTMLDPGLPLTVIEYDEWGNPAEEDYYNYIMQYSPYDNVKPQAYPNMLVVASLNDTRVQYWEPAKWVAKLRALKTDNNVLLLRTNMGAGHAGVSGRYSQIEEKAFEYAFILDMLNMD